MPSHTCSHCQDCYETDPRGGPAFRPIPETGPAPHESSARAHRAIARWRTGRSGFRQLHHALTNASHDDPARLDAMMRTAMGAPRWQDRTGHRALRTALARLRRDPVTLEQLTHFAARQGAEEPHEAMEETFDTLERPPRFMPAHDPAGRRHDLLCAVTRHASGEPAGNAVRESATTFARADLGMRAHDSAPYARETHELAHRLSLAHSVYGTHVTCPSCGARHRRNDPETAWRGSDRAVDCAVEVARLLRPGATDATLEAQVHHALVDANFCNATLTAPEWRCIIHAARYADGLMGAEVAEAWMRERSEDDPQRYHALLGRLAKYAPWPEATRPPMQLPDKNEADAPAPARPTVQDHAMRAPMVADHGA